MRHRLGSEAEHGAKVHLLGDRGAAPVPPVREGPVEGRDQTDGAGGTRPLDAREHLVARADPVHLEERLGARADDLFDRPAGEGAQPQGGAPGRGRPRDGDLTFGVDGLDPGG